MGGIRSQVNGNVGIDDRGERNQ